MFEWKDCGALLRNKNHIFNQRKPKSSVVPSYRPIQYFCWNNYFFSNIHFLVFPTFGGTWRKHVLLRPSKTDECLEEWPGPIHRGTKPECTVLVATVHSRGSDWTQRCLHPFSGRCLSKYMRNCTFTHKEMQTQFFAFISQVQMCSGDTDGLFQINGRLSVSCPGRIHHLRRNSDLWPSDRRCGGQQ